MDDSISIDPGNGFLGKTASLDKDLVRFAIFGAIEVSGKEHRQVSGMGLDPLADESCGSGSSNSAAVIEVSIHIKKSGSSLKVPQDNP